MGYRKYINVLLILILILAMAVSSCRKTRKEVNNTITVTIEPLRYFTEEIAGDIFDIKTMIPVGSNPETYDPTPQQMVKLNDSRAYIAMGNLGFEMQWIKKLKSNLPKIPFFDVSKNIKYIYTEGHSCNKHNENEADPHIWMSTENAQIIAYNICQILIQLSPEHTEVLTKRYEQLKNKIIKINSEIKEIIQSGVKEEAFLIYHPTLTYYAKEYGFLQIAIEKDGKEPTPQYIKQLLNECDKYNVKTIFIQPEFDQRNTELIANQTHTKIIEINPLSYNWNEQMIAITQQLVRK